MTGENQKACLIVNWNRYIIIFQVKTHLFVNNINYYLHHFAFVLNSVISFEDEDGSFLESLAIFLWFLLLSGFSVYLFITFFSLAFYCFSIFSIIMSIFLLRFFFLCLSIYWFYFSYVFYFIASLFLLSFYWVSFLCLAFYCFSFSLFDCTHVHIYIHTKKHSNIYTHL